MVQNRRERREREGIGQNGLYRNTDQHPDPPLLFSTFSFLSSFFYRFSLPFRKRNPSRYPIKHGLSFAVVEISKITVGDQLSFGSRSMLNRPLSSNLFSSRTCLLFQATPIWMEERKGKGAGFVSLLSRYKTSRRNEFSRDRSIDRILRDELDGEVVRRNKSRKLS